MSLRCPPVRKPIDDPEPHVTAKIREQITRRAQGQTDPEEFAGEARATIFPDHVADLKAQFGPMGSIRELTLGLPLVLWARLRCR